MFSKNINFKNFNIKQININERDNLRKILKTFLNEKNQVLASLKKDYKNSYSKKLLIKFKKIKELRLIGMGGSILGAKAIYDFLGSKFKKFIFIDSFFNNFSIKKDNTKLNLIISKSGNTMETISNVNILVKNNQSNIFITENKKSYLMDLANKLKADVVHHNNFIGGRYSVLSEVGMLPAELMGFKSEKFRRLNYLVKKKIL